MIKQIKAQDAHECKCWMCGRTARVMHVVRGYNKDGSNIIQGGSRRVECPWCGKTNVKADMMLEVPSEVVA